MAKNEDDFDDLLDDEGFDAVGADEEEEGETVLASLSSAARTLALRRAIEQRVEQRRMNQMLNYLELEFEDEE